MFKIVSVLLLGLMLAAFIHHTDRKHREQLASATQSKARQDLEILGQKVEFIFRIYYQGLRTIARMPDLGTESTRRDGLRLDQQQAIQEIFNNLAENIHVSEVYIAPADFDPDSPQHRNPLAAFEHAPVQDVPRGKSSHAFADELQVYRKIHKHMAYFRQHHPLQADVREMNYPAIISQKILTADRSRQRHPHDHEARAGIVYSLPYYDPHGKLQGVISGVLLAEVIADMLQHGEYLLSKHGVGIYSGKLIQSQNLYNKPLRKDSIMSLDIRDLADNWVLIDYSPEKSATFSARLLLVENTTYILYVCIIAIITLTITYLINQDKSRQRLVDSEQKNAAILESAFDAIITIDRHGIIESFNTSAEKMFGYTADEVIGKNVALLMPKSVAEHHDQYLQRHIAAGAKTIVGKRREEIGLRRNGEQFPLHLAVTDTEINGELHFTGVISDITEAKRQQYEIALHRNHLEELVEEKTEELVLAKEAAENASHAKSEFLANMSHELRTPIHTVLSFAELGIKKHASASSEKLHQYFERIQEGGRRQLDLLNDLLDLSKLEAGKVVYRLADHDLLEVLNTQISQHEALAEQRHLKMVLHRETEVSKAWFDQDKIAQVIRNLLSNAIKFAAPHTEIGIRIFLRQTVINNHPTEMLAVEIEDTGIGIPRDELDNIFDKFVQSSKTKSGAGGTGLGLSICREIIEAHNGLIWADSDGEHVSRFTFCLPLSAT
ncbi:MAG: PAS domain-containing sensor histidine kinase [Gammaproteobacteria bacterium]